uniref:C2H2-type domain-containing protein n=1 Tax=Chelydra serpentina TaxID=8475 RepID=A0A8C3T7D9_CHESE
MHKLIHSSDRPHKCPECDKGFIRTADVWRHLRNVHKIERSKILGNGMVRNPWSSMHQNQNGGGDTYQQCSDDQKPGGEQSKPYICPTCGKGFRKSNLLSKHKVIHRQDKPYQCQECGKSFIQLLRLKRHQQTHSGERPFYCEECGGTFTRLASLQRHQRIHTGEKPYSCCPECDKGFIRTADVWRHLRNVHKIERSKGVLGNGMVRNRGSILHQNKHGHGDTDKQCSENQKPAGEESKPYICLTCGKGFCKPNLLSRHKVIHRQDRPHKCQECGKSFVERLKLKRHQQIHSGERPFYCEECGRTFTQLVTLQCHQRTHTGEKPYSCAYCGRRFTASATLRKHERIHKVDKS